MFQTVKRKVQLNIVEKFEIAKNTSFNRSGIYMLYINDFSDDKIIPFYIGQTTDLQKRYKDHLTELLAINRFRQTDVTKYILGEHYDGHYKVCKILKYMVEHQCTLFDFHVIVLEFVDDNSLLNQREQDYFREYLPMYFGFNQLNTITYYNSIKLNFDKQKSEQFYQYAFDEIDCIDKYYEYGFTAFNYKHSFISQPILKENVSLNLQNRLSSGISYLKKKFYSSEDQYKLQNMHKLMIDSMENFRLCNLLISERNKFFDVKMNDILSKFNIKSLRQRQNLYDALVKHDKASLVRFNKYLATRKIYEDIFSLLLPEMNRFHEIGRQAKPYKDLYDSQSTEYKNIRDDLKSERLKLLLSEREYKSYPLHDLYSSRPFKHDNIIANNICEIHFLISNAGRNRHPELLKIDYRINLNGMITEKRELFIRNETTTFGELENDFYTEKDIVNSFVFKFTPFNPIPIRNNTYDYMPCMISPLAEYKTGINEYTCRNKSKYELNEVITDLKAHTNDSTKFDIYISESLNCLEESLGKFSNDSLIMKILSVRKKKHR